MPAAYYTTTLLQADTAAPGGAPGIDQFAAGGSLGPSDGVTLAGSERWSVRWRTLVGGTAAGVQLIEVDTGAMVTSILPTRGMGLWKLQTPGNTIGWNSPVERPVHPQFVNLKSRGGLGWLDGFNELLCRCGLAYMGPPCQDEGLDVTLHGRIANLPAHRVQVSVEADGPGVIRIEGVVDETTMFGAKLRLTTTYTFTVGTTVVDVEDRVENLGSSPARFGLLYHINVGAPLVGEGTEVLVPFEELAPRTATAAAGLAHYARYEAPRPGRPEEVYFFRPRAEADGWVTAALTNSDQSRAFGVRFDHATLPWFIVWKNLAGERDGYVTGLEPATNLPNPWPFERSKQRPPVLQPGEHWTGRLALAVAEGTEQVRQLTDRVAACQARPAGEHPLPFIHPEPHPEWSAP